MSERAADGLPAHWPRIETVDLHTAGEPLRVVVSGLPDLPGDSILAKRSLAREQHDALRRRLMFEPRGHADMYGAWLVDPVSSDGDIGVLFLHNEGYSTMCGHGIIGLVTAGVSLDLFPIRDPECIRIDTPAGRVVARANLRDGRLESVSFRNVPSFVLASHCQVDVPGLGPVSFDLAFGGAFYAYVDAVQLPFPLTPDQSRRIVTAGQAIKAAVAEQMAIRHPEGDPELNYLYGVIFVDFDVPGVHSRNCCVFADGELDRSPTGTGVSGRAAIHYQRRDLHLNEFIEIESLIGTRFSVRCVDLTRVGEHHAVIPEVTGTAHITGRSTFVVDPDDPLADGFLLR